MYNFNRTLSPKAEQRMFDLSKRMDEILSQPVVPGSDRKRIDGMLAEMANIRTSGETFEDRKHNEVFKRYLKGEAWSTLVSSTPELRAVGPDFLAGSATPSWTNGTEGGFLVPQQFAKSVATGLALVDPLLDPRVATVIMEPGFKLSPLQLPGWDLSTIAAVNVTETSQHNSDTAPGLDQKLLNKYTYRLSLGASLEWEEDQATFDTATDAMGKAFGIGFARGIGADLVNGDGSSAPQGVLTGAHDSGITTAAAGVLGLSDFTDIFFSVNAIYRNSPKCAWLMADATYKKVRNAKDSSNRPLFPIVDDKLMILGKPVYVCPSLPSTAGSKGIVFGDISYFYVHCTTLFLKRRLQLPGYVEYGKALYTGLMSVDSVVNDPTGGSMAPIVYATLHS